MFPSNLYYIFPLILILVLLLHQLLLAIATTSTLLKTLSIKLLKRAARGGRLLLVILRSSFFVNNVDTGSCQFEYLVCHLETISNELLILQLYISDMVDPHSLSVTTPGDTWDLLLWAYPLHLPMHLHSRNLSLFLLYPRAPLVFLSLLLFLRLLSPLIKLPKDSLIVVCTAPILFFPVTFLLFIVLKL